MLICFRHLPPPCVCKTTFISLAEHVDAHLHSRRRLFITPQHKCGVGAGESGFGSNARGNEGCRARQGARMQG